MVGVKCVMQIEMSSALWPPRQSKGRGSKGNGLCLECGTPRVQVPAESYQSGTNIGLPGGETLAFQEVKHWLSRG